MEILLDEQITNLSAAGFLISFSPDAFVYLDIFLNIRHKERGCEAARSGLRGRAGWGPGQDRRSLGGGYL
jgi:hypothetical protein